MISRSRVEDHVFCAECNKHHWVISSRKLGRLMPHLTKEVLLQIPDAKPACPHLGEISRSSWKALCIHYNSGLIEP